MKTYRVTGVKTSLYTYEVEAENEAEAVEKASASENGTLVSASMLWDAVEVEVFDEEPAPEKSFPRGFGTYLRRISGGETEARAVLARCQQAGMKWVSFMVEASDGYVVPLAITETYARVFRDAGFDLFVWTLPGEARSSSIEESMEAGALALEYANTIGAVGVMLDIEAAYKGKADTLRALITIVRDGLNETQTLGIVSYPIPSYHKDLAWSEFSAADWGSPMFYETASDPALVEKGYVQWSAYVSVFAPSLDGWSGTGATGAERLKEDITRVCGEPPSPRVEAAAIWSEQQMDDAKRFAVLEMSVRYGWV